MGKKQAEENNRVLSERWFSYLYELGTIYNSLFSFISLPRSELETLAAIRRLTDKNEKPGPARICDILHTSRQTMTSTLDKLEQRGLVRRSPDPVDRRRLILEPTRKGIDLLKKILEQLIAIHHERISGIPAAEFEQFLVTLKKIADSLAQTKEKLEV